MPIADLPEGFARHYRRSPVTDPWEPLYSRVDETGAVRLALRIDRPHTNSRGFVHGGLISALADNAMGLTCARTLGEGASLVTVGLAVDFIGSGQIGQWLEVAPRLIRPGSTLCFTDALVTADGAPCARANATFRIIARPREAA
jgi:uncharacterized protein (TIGR00369 family)